MKRVAAILFAAMLSGCDKAPPPAPVSSLPAPVFGTSAITGHIHFVGTPPERKMIDTSTCQDGNRVQQEETIVVSPDGGLRDVVVYLKDAPASDGSSLAPATIDQVGCRYVPHALAVQVNQPLKITTSDAFLHNVHYTNAATGDENFGMSHAGESKVVSFDRTQNVRMECNVHGWMSANVAVLANPFFGVSGVDGTFKINRVPAGHYAVTAWHPLLGERSASVEVAADGTAQVNIDFAPPK